MTPEELAEIEAHPKGLPIPFLNVERLVAEVRRLRAMMPHPSWDDDAAGFIARLREIATNTRLRCPKDKDESCATCHEAGEMLGVLEMLDAEREAVAALRIERDAALAEVARLSRTSLPHMCRDGHEEIRHAGDD